jgi:hypothetical protein
MNTQSSAAGHVPRAALAFWAADLRASIFLEHLLTFVMHSFHLTHLVEEIFLLSTDSGDG